MHIKICFLNIYYVIIILIIPFYSCSPINDYKMITEEYLNSITTSKGYYVNVVIPISEDEIYIVSVTLLLYTYDHCYNSIYPNATDFLIALYSGKLNDLKRKFEECTGYDIEESKVKIDKIIMNQYYKYGLEYIIGRYLVKIEDGYDFKNKVNETVAKIMFVNNFYLYSFDADLIFTKELLNFSIPENK